MIIEGMVDQGAIIAFLLAMVRASAWLTVAPPFGRSLVPTRIRVAVGVAIGALMSQNVDVSSLDTDVVSLSFAIAYQALIGVALGFVVQLMFAAFQAAGSLVDFASGFSVGAMYDPLSGSQNATVARLYNMVATVLLFVGGGHVMIVAGFMRSFRAAPIAGPSIEQLNQLLVSGLGNFFIAALQIAFPLAAALMMTEISLALLARAAPQSNVLMIGLSLKSVVLLFLLGSSLSLLPHAVGNFAEDASRLAFGGG